MRTEAAEPLQGSARGRSGVAALPLSPHFGYTPAASRLHLCYRSAMTRPPRVATPPPRRQLSVTALRLVARLAEGARRRRLCAATDGVALAPPLCA